MSQPTPAALGFRMPAEWEPHEATWLAWPHRRDDWPDKFGPIPWVYAEIVRHLTRSEPVGLLVHDGRGKRRAAEALESVGVDFDQIQFIRCPQDRGWTRDSGPIFLVRDVGGLRQIDLLDWKFNGWAKYDNYQLDNRIPRRLAQKLDIRRWKPKAEVGDRSIRVVLEGGAIDVNGRGSVLTTEECLLSRIQARNPDLNRAGIERVLAEFLGARHVIWLGRGIVGDDTHGHVDDVARFVNPSTVVVAQEPNTADPNHEPLRENWERLQSARDQDGNPLRVIALPMPRPLAFQGQRLPASYANFYIANHVVLVPTFNDPADRQALGLLADLFPDREVVGIHAVDLVWGLGTLHCLTQQQPRDESPSER